MKELRTIIFTKAEAIAAIIAYKRRQKAMLPQGTIKSLDISEGEITPGILTVESDHGERQIVALSQSDIAAALVLECLERKVPLPRQARKFVCAVDGQMILALDIPHEIVKMLMGTAKAPATQNAHRA